MECPDLATFFHGGRSLDPTDIVHSDQVPGAAVRKSAAPNLSPYPAGSEPGGWTNNTD